MVIGVVVVVVECAALLVHGGVGRYGGYRVDGDTSYCCGACGDKDKAVVAAAAATVATAAAICLLHVPLKLITTLTHANATTLHAS